MALTLGALLEASLLVVNAICVLHEKRFLAKGKYVFKFLKVVLLNDFFFVNFVLLWITNSSILTSTSEERERWILFCFLFDKKIYLSKLETEFKISIFEDETPFVTTFNLLTKLVSLFNQKIPWKIPTKTKTCKMWYNQFKKVI